MASIWRYNLNGRTEEALVSMRLTLVWMGHDIDFKILMFKENVVLLKMTSQA